MRAVLLLPAFAASIACLSSTPPPGLTITPGPGLPSLESLGLSIADIWNTTVHHKPGPENHPPSKLGRRLDRWCAYPGKLFADRDAAIACANYLWRLGRQSCVAVSGGTIMCWAQGGKTRIGAIVESYPVGGPKTAASYCSDVALAVFNVINYCPNYSKLGGTIVGGYDAANGNGHLEVELGGTPVVF